MTSLEARLEKEAAEKAEREACEKDAKESTKKEATKDAAREKAEQEVETIMAAKAPQKAGYEKTVEVALAQGESSKVDLASLVIKILEELQKEHQLVRARLDK